MNTKMRIAFFLLAFAACGVQAGGVSGTTYDVVESYESDVSNAYENRCMGRGSDRVRYRYETRKYTEYKDGAAVKTWMKSYKRFIRCLG
ncbi:hypothetical protein [Teredinibacter purpureus]|uniref:hypothetical protein n=1 Tax=Teredinibacter purpureus TaxID=2731756 RepID=UPI0005F76FD1|nr:hypothetical protein [Teredinibacter purpureus]